MVLELVDKVQSVYDDRALTEQHVATIIAKVDHTSVQDAMRREWCRHCNHFDFRDRYLKQIIEVPLANPRKDVAKLAKKVSRHFTNRERPYELLVVLERKLERESGFRGIWRCWDPIKARCQVYFPTGNHRCAWKGFQKSS